MATLRVRASQKNRRHSRYFTQRKLNTRNWRQKSWKAKQQTVRQSGLGDGRSCCPSWDGETDGGGGDTA